MTKIFLALLCCATLSAQTQYPGFGRYPHISVPATPAAGSRCGVNTITKLWTCIDNLGVVTTGTATPPGSTNDLVTNGGGGVFGSITPATGITTFLTTSPPSGLMTFLATPSSTNLNFLLTTKSGSGLAVFDTQPTFITSASIGVGYLSVTKTAGTTGTTIGLLVKYDASGNVITAATSEVASIGVAASTATLGNPVEVAQRGNINCIADNTTVIGNFAIPGTSTAGRCRDSGTADPTTIATSVQIVGIFRSVATVGNSASIESFGHGHFGAQITGGGSVTDFSVVTANGVSASVANSTSTPAATFTLGAITPTTVKGLTITTTTGTFTLTNGKTLSVLKTLSLDGTDGTTMTFPATSATLARTDAANTFTGVQTMTSPALTTPAITGLPTGSGVATANTVSTLVARDGSGNFAAGTITAALTGNVTGNVAGNASGTAGTITGLLTSGNIPKIDILDASAFAADAGSTDTFAATLSPAITAYVTGTHYRFKANTINTGAATVNFNAVGAKSIVKVAGGITTALADGDIRAGQWVDLVYDGTNMQMQSTLGNAASGGSGTPCTITGLSFQYNNAGAFGCVATWTTNGTDVTVAASTIDLSAATVLLPNSAISTAYLNGLYPQLAVANTFVGKQTTGLTASLAGLRLTCGTLPSSPTAGDIACDAAGVTFFYTGLAWSSLVTTAASTTAAGIAEAAIASEVTTASDSLRYISPDALRGSDYGKNGFAAECVPDATALSTGDGKCYIGPIPSEYTGWNIVKVVTGVGAAVSSSGAITVDIDRCGVVATGIRCSGTNVSIFSTLVTIDANEDSTSTAATPAVINASNDDLTTDQWLRVNIDGAGTGTQGLYVWVFVQKP